MKEVKGPTIALKTHKRLVRFCKFLDLVVYPGQTEISLGSVPRSPGYKTFVMLNSSEYGISTAYKDKILNNKYVLAYGTQKL